MTINAHEILEVCQTLSKDKNIRVTVTQSAKGGLIAGAGAFVGGVCMGPAGIAIGAMLGGIFAYSTAEEFKPAALAIMEMPEYHKRRLVDSIQTIIADLDISDAKVLLVMLNGNTVLASNIVNEIVGSLQSHYCTNIMID